MLRLIGLEMEKRIFVNIFLSAKSECSGWRACVDCQIHSALVVYI